FAPLYAPAAPLSNAGRNQCIHFVLPKKGDTSPFAAIIFYYNPDGKKTQEAGSLLWCKNIAEKIRKFNSNYIEFFRTGEKLLNNSRFSYIII
ncbi:MAG: hypothetical protein IIY16_05295, partial [Oscillospiraceae bacterium]|nr:hypothetical protein [Oscillospiraceae bacterium]